MGVNLLYLLLSVFFVVFAGVMSGLTLGLMSQDVMELKARQSLPNNPFTSISGVANEWRFKTKGLCEQDLASQSNFNLVGASVCAGGGESAFDIGDVGLVQFNRCGGVVV